MPDTHERLPHVAVTIFRDGHFDVVRFETTSKRDAFLSKMKDNVNAKAMTWDDAHKLGIQDNMHGEISASTRNHRARLAVLLKKIFEPSVDITT